MKRQVNAMLCGLIGTGLFLLSGCATMPGGIAASSTPLEGRKYTVLEKTSATSNCIRLLGVIPISGSNNTRSAIDKAARYVGGDALIDVTVEGFNQYWILFSRDVTYVEGIGIRFEK
jgi:starvation-inducible outer membrane lipoprotein